MNRKRLPQIIATIVLSILLINCKKTTESESNWGEADFTSFVAIGNSLTAGVADGALYKDSQKNSFPNLIAQMAGLDDFEQPLMGGNGFSFNETEGRLSLNIFVTPPSIDFLDAGTEDNRNLNRAYNNLGIPLIRAAQLYNATTAVEADSNHFVDKILRGSGRNAIEEALSLDPTLITLWIGSNDVLESATLGLADNNSLYTPSDEFATHLDNVVNQLTVDTNAPIFIANIVDITDLPYFTSLPPSITIGGTQTYLFGECENNIIRELTDDDIVLFWALPDYLNLKTNGNISEATALNDTLILDVSEKAEIKTIIDEYNEIIKNIANSSNQIYLIDMYLIFNNIAENGYEVGGITYTAELIYFDSNGDLNLNLTNTLFSYDALHPNKFGYSSFANAFIEVINASLNANIPLISELSDLN